MKELLDLESLCYSKGNYYCESYQSKLNRKKLCKNTWVTKSQDGIIYTLNFLKNGSVNLLSQSFNTEGRYEIINTKTIILNFNDENHLFNSLQIDEKILKLRFPNNDKELIFINSIFFNDKKDLKSNISIIENLIIKKSSIIDYISGLIFAILLVFYALYIVLLSIIGDSIITGFRYIDIYQGVSDIFEMNKWINSIPLSIGFVMSKTIYLFIALISLNLAVLYIFNAEKTKNFLTLIGLALISFVAMFFDTITLGGSYLIIYFIILIILFFRRIHINIKVTVFLILVSFWAMNKPLYQGISNESEWYILPLIFISPVIIIPLLYNIIKYLVYFLSVRNRPFIKNIDQGYVKEAIEDRILFLFLDKDEDQYELANCYLYGKGTAVNKRKALHWFSKSSNEKAENMNNK